MTLREAMEIAFKERGVPKWLRQFALSAADQIVPEGAAQAAAHIKPGMEREAIDALKKGDDAKAQSLTVPQCCNQ